MKFKLMKLSWCDILPSVLLELKHMMLNQDNTMQILSTTLCQLLGLSTLMVCFNGSEVNEVQAYLHLLAR